jgi:osmotically-inducible protein OsmY
MQRRLFVFGAGGLISAGLMRPAEAQLLDMLTAPKTLIDRAIEARTTSDIAKDNEVVIKVNKVMADVGSVKASTEIYEQRLLVTGLFDDKAVYDKFEKGVRAVTGVKRLYWHVAYLSKADQEAKKKSGEFVDWTDVLTMETKAKARLIGTKGVADVNFRITADSAGSVFVLGRARSADEKKLALARAKDGEGVKKVVDYVEVRA